MTTKNQLAEAVVIERTFNASVARVWKALTDENEESRDGHARGWNSTLDKLQKLFLARSDRS